MTDQTTNTNNPDPENPDPQNPENTVDSVLEPLFVAGATVERKADSATTGVAVAGVTAASAITYRITSVWTLQTPATVRLSLGRETLRHKFVKVFKKEIQVGDKEFDDLVYITTATPDTTRQLLEQEADFREAVEELVRHGGHIAVDNELVTIVTIGRTPEQAAPAPSLEARLLTPLIH